MKLHTNGITLNVQEYSKEGTPILFLHYLNGTADIWNKIIPAFTGSHRVLALDLRGHGKSDQPDTGYDIETVAQDVLGVLDALEIRQTHIVGSSYGCYVGTFLASRWPDRILSLVNSEGALVNHSGPGGLYEEPKEEHLAEIFTEPEPEFDSKGDFLQFMKENWQPWNAAREQSMQDYEPRKLDNGNVSFITKQSTVKEIVADLYEVHLQDWYKSVTCPVLFLPAEIEGDLTKKLTFIQEVESGLPYSKTVVIPESEHAMMFDHDKQMSREIIEFLGRIS
ncbi:MAG TPA: alpha/beta hydrolase [Bacillales bacterium]|nr:alpha/beta hydrolase [Bacillales bacterium]